MYVVYTAHYIRATQTQPHEMAMLLNWFAEHIARFYFTIYFVSFM